MRVIVKVVLMLRLGLIKSIKFFDDCHDWLVVICLSTPDAGFKRCFLFVVCIEQLGCVLRAFIGTLFVEARRVMDQKENVQKVFAAIIVSSKVTFTLSAWSVMPLATL